MPVKTMSLMAKDSRHCEHIQRMCLAHVESRHRDEKADHTLADAFVQIETKALCALCTVLQVDGYNGKTA